MQQKGRYVTATITFSGFALGLHFAGLGSLCGAEDAFICSIGTSLPETLK
jgi:hypothetical protein